MALTLLVTPAPGDTIQSSVWINEFNNIYNNPVALISPLTASINLNSQILSGAATFSGAITFSSTITVTGSSTLNGAVTLGDAAADNITVNGTIVSNLIFTDATYDIGASGATRPRDIFLSRNLVVGNTIELGHASDTTLSRVSAGIISVEGNNVITANNKISALSATTSAELAGVISNETGSGLLVFGTAPALSAPTITGIATFGTPGSTSGAGTNDVVLANATYLRSSNAAGSAAITLIGMDSSNTIQLGSGTTAVGVNLNMAANSYFAISDSYMGFTEMTAPGAGAANSARLYAVDNGAGKTQLMVIFSSGAAQPLATQP